VLKNMITKSAKKVF